MLLAATILLLMTDECAQSEVRAAASHALYVPDLTCRLHTGGERRVGASLQELLGVA
jgi:hypothetical protein